MVQMCQLFQTPFLINNDLSWTASVNQTPLPASSFPLLNDKLASVSSLLNSLATHISFKDGNAAINWLEVSLEALTKASVTCDGDEQSKLVFLAEQISLCKRAKTSVRYSNSFMISSFSIAATSSSANENLRQQNILTLPSSQWPFLPITKLF